MREVEQRRAVQEMEMVRGRAGQLVGRDADARNVVIEEVDCGHDGCVIEDVAA
jgi:hypothetical protein